VGILEIKDLSVVYRTEGRLVRAVDEVSLSVDKAQHLGVIGESGCGKTTLMRAIVGVLPQNARIEEGQILFDGRDLLKLGSKGMRELRWKEIATIPQASMDSLDPVQRVGRQLREILVVRGNYERAAAARRAVDLIELVGLDPEKLKRYPHELSGGMKQRAIIAMALALEPSLLIADEPVTALDVIVQHQVLDVFKRLENELRLTVLLITHDISVVADACESVAVMYAGRIVERAATGRFFKEPLHPYSLGLQRGFPNLLERQASLISIEGYPPDLSDPPEACRFAPRCPFAEESCREIDPQLEEVVEGHSAACLRAGEMDSLRRWASDPRLWSRTEAASQQVSAGAEGVHVAGELR
jgi:oligopeptide/dipeptide ABC transporter ATP-binding protein